MDVKGVTLGEQISNHICPKQEPPAAGYISYLVPRCPPFSAEIFCLGSKRQAGQLAMRQPRVATKVSEVRWERKGSLEPWPNGFALLSLCCVGSLCFHPCQQSCQHSRLLCEAHDALHEVCPAGAFICPACAITPALLYWAHGSQCQE